MCDVPLLFLSAVTHVVLCSRSNSACFLQGCTVPGALSCTAFAAFAAFAALAAGCPHLLAEVDDCCLPLVERLQSGTLYAWCEVDAPPVAAQSYTEHSSSSALRVLR
jgi:hypothetical protein